MVVIGKRAGLLREGGSKQVKEEAAGGLDGLLVVWEKAKDGTGRPVRTPLLLRAGRGKGRVGPTLARWCVVLRRAVGHACGYRGTPRGGVSARPRLSVAARRGELLIGAAAFDAPARAGAPVVKPI